MSQISAKFVREYTWRMKMRRIIVWVVQIAAAVALAFFCAFFFGQKVTITESSMEPTIYSGDKILMNTLTYKVSSPKRGDIIVFHMGDNEQNLIIKRVIALPGETIQIQDGQILIDGMTYTQDGDFPAINNPGMAESPVTLKSGEYFVLGDNRNDSEDSRHLDIGPVDENQIVGKLWLRYSPAGSFGIVK